MEGTPQPKQDSKIQVTKNGPYIVSGKIPIYRMTVKCDGSTNIPSEWLFAGKLKSQEKNILCRCGQSSTKPFCDGTHFKVKFDGTENSGNIPFEQMSKQIDGPQLTLKDAEILCASARFCHRGGDIWDQIPKTDDSKIKENCIRNESDCPSGRLLIIDKTTGKPIEPTLNQAIGLIEDPAIGVDGPLWVRGRIPIYSADGELYETRNRVTLCRCGKSSNKPFCDSSHYPEEYREER